MHTNFEIVKTADGSQTILDNVRNTSYHSMHGAVTESKHVFLDAGFKHIIAQNTKRIRILEMGFGTGLNALLTYLETMSSDLQVEYVGIESNPLPFSITDQLSYPAFLNAAHADKVFRRMHAESNLKEQNFTLEVLPGSVEEIALPCDNTLIYYDAFGPNDQSEHWTHDALARIVSAMVPGGVLVTYCAQGQFKRHLKELGCTVESLPGPPGKREIVRATLSKT